MPRAGVVSIDDVLIHGLRTRDYASTVRRNRIALCCGEAWAALQFFVVATFAVPTLLAMFILAAHNSSAIDAIFAHLDDTCDRPLGTLLAAYWLGLLLASLVVSCGLLYERCLERCECCRGCRSIPDRVFKGFFSFAMTVHFGWLVWFLSEFTQSTVCSDAIETQALVFVWLYASTLTLALLIALWPMMRQLGRRRGWLSDPGRDLCAKLPKVAVAPGVFDDDGGKYPSGCPVCMEDFGPEDDVRVTPCGHAFHHGCLADWLRRSTTCPLCRDDIARGRQEQALVQLEPQEGV